MRSQRYRIDFFGIFCSSALLNQSPVLLILGRASLSCCGTVGERCAWQGDVTLATDAALKQGRLRIVATMLAVTQLNPHVYLDTFVVLGSQLPSTEARRWFAFGTVSASIIWFFGLALLAAQLLPRLRTVRAQRIINLLVGGVMWFIALICQVRFATRELRLLNTIINSRQALAGECHVNRWPPSPDRPSAGTE